MNRTIKILTLILSATLLYSCDSTKKYANFVNLKYAQQNLKINNNSYIEYDSISNKSNDSVAKAEKVKSLLIPALIYWKWDNSVRCELSSQQTNFIIKNNFQNIADSLKIKEKLNGQKLIISIEAVPRAFVYTNSGYVIFLLFAYSAGFLEAITPENEKLILSYQVVKGTTKTKSGRIELMHSDLPMKNLMKSKKKFIWEYLDQYESNMKDLSRLSIEKIYNEL